ncbi:MAG: MFS transporter [Peptostreptococcus sp.]|uniref:CynX/NimT family MFS transporter n=1 Tax=Peptostreptococcus sp. TaxID=1262 RepID=UPI002FC71E91
MNQTNNKNGKNLDSHSKKSSSMIMIIGILFIAANLRAPLTSVGPLVSLIRESLHISNTLAGMITTLPLFAFALFSPLVPAIARKFETEVVIFYSVIMLTVGILLRSWSAGFGLFLGTVVIGLSISVGNVLIPSFIKKEFPEQIGLMTGLYSVFMNIFAALASGISIPLALGLGLGWSGALRVWAILSFVSIIIWIPQLKRKRQEKFDLENLTNTSKISDEFKASTEINEAINKHKPTAEKTSMWKSPLAWQVTIYMGLQSMVFYCMVAWLPDILIQQGMSSGNAGWMLSLMQLALIPMTFVGSVLAGRRASQRSLVTLGSVCVIIGLLGLLLFGNSGFVFLFIIILGIGAGFNFSLSMMFFNLRTKNADEAARLSGMAQAIGYLLAAFGPMFFGYLHDSTSNWSMPLVILIGFSATCLIAGLGASRDLYVADNHKQAM